ncbi:amidohydrolase [Rhodococcus sp. NPDC057529]|uniref:amidohydrolase n=1 Tax=Rhodococcus sp. NPDC057529 TaxID=3346158 RepID=UPI003671558B
MQETEKVVSRPLDAAIQIVHGPRIVTLTQDAPEGIAFLAGRIVDTGGLAELTARFPDAETTHVDGALLVPGFNDAHLHPFFAAEPQLRVDLGPGPAPSAEAALAVLRTKARDTPPGQWVVGVGYDVVHSTGMKLDRKSLDAVSSDHPIYVIGSTWHTAVANSAALDEILPDSDPDSYAGGVFTRDTDGALDGWLHEAPHMRVAWAGSGQRPLLPALPTAIMVDALESQNSYLNAQGITSYTDALVTPEIWAAYDQARRDGRLTTRVSMAVWHTYRDLVTSLGMSSGFGDEWLRLIGVKFMYDGALSGGTCLCAEPYESTTGTGNGIRVLGPADLTEAVVDLHTRGIRVCIHANGDAAIGEVLDAIEAAQLERPAVSVNHRIEHCSILDDRLIKRIAAAGVTPVPFGGFVSHHGDELLRLYGPERAAQVARHRSLLDAGVTVAGSSDYPCGPASVLSAIQSLTTRATSTGQVIGPAERLSVEDALRVYTSGSAAATGEELVKGRLAPGYLADFTVLSRDIFEVDPTEIRDVEIVSTWVGGERVWHR